MDSSAAAASHSCSVSDGGSITPSREAQSRLAFRRLRIVQPVTRVKSRATNTTSLDDVREHRSDPLRATLPLLLAADRFVFDFDGRLDLDRPLVWIAAPEARECVLAALTTSDG